MKSTEVPQANDLSKVRAVVQAVKDGARTQAVIGRVTGITPRHVGYNVQAALLLGLVEDDGRVLVLTRRGVELLETFAASRQEADRLRDAILASESIARFAPGLLGSPAPSTDLIASHIQRLTSLSSATARRRAQTLLAWRAQVVGAQGAMFASAELPAGAPGAPEPGETIQLAWVRISRYGPIRDAQARLGAFTVILGRNASGKSTFMDSILFVADALEHGPLGAVRLRTQVLEDLLWNGEGDSFRFAFDFSLPAALAVDGATMAFYQLEVGRLKDGSVGVKDEQLLLHPPLPADELFEVQVRSGRTPRGWRRTLSLSETGTAWFRAERTDWKTVFNLGSRKLALSAVPEDIDRFKVTHRIRDVFRRGVQRLALHPDAMKAPCSPLLSTAFRPDGANLPLVVRRLEQRDPELFQSWKDHLREALSDVEDVRVVERPEDRHLYLKLRYQGGLELPAWRLSEGTLRLLALTLLSFAAEEDSIYLVEEPENGVHPQALEAVHQVLAYGGAAQVLVATHSPVFVGLLEPSQILCFLRESGSTQIIPGDRHPMLKRWKKENNLGDLFAARVIG